MDWSYSSRSRNKLQTCHGDLIILMMAALDDPECPCDITILEGGMLAWEAAGLLEAVDYFGEQE